MTEAISAGLGLVTSLFGRGRQSGVPSYVAENYRLQNDAFRKAMGLYDSTNIEALDRQAVDTLGDSAMKRALATIANYDAQAAGRGSAMDKGDTAKTRARTQIAADSAEGVANLEAQLLTSRPQRRAALLPSPGAIAGNSSNAMYMDQQNNADAAAEANSIADLIQIVSRFFPKKGAQSVPAGSNDLYSGVFGRVQSDIPMEWQPGYRP